ncbi:MAG: transcriptional repressor [Chloroflexi bacterium]|nr:transcriptional repressor [Chloroflexota bacterium]
MLETVIERLQGAGHRLTKPRMAVLQVLESEGEHLSPAEILARGQAIYPALSRATVYRTLELLSELGLLRLIHAGDLRSRVACVEMSHHGHHHLLCVSCGCMIPFEECVVGELEATLSQRLGFEIKGHLLEFYGLCEQCREHQKTEVE